MIRYADEDSLMHFGIKRKSGRYPWGSGGNEVTRARDFLSMADDLKRQGLSESEIARGLGLGQTGKDGKFYPSSTDLRAAKQIAKASIRAADVSQVQRLKEKGNSTNGISTLTGIPEATVRSMLATPIRKAQEIIDHVVDMLRHEVDTQGMVDVGVGVEYHVGVSETRLKTAIAMLKDEGYTVNTVQVDQLGTSQKTSVKVLAKPGVTYRDIVSDTSKIGSISKHSDDGGRSFLGLAPPKNLDSKRLLINYKEDGGANADGVMYLRPNVADLSMGGKNYAQVRIQVDDTHYLKGMAIYKDDLPKGVDVVFNTNKSYTGNKLDALKPLKKIQVAGPDGKLVDGPDIDRDNPFGAVIKPGGQKGVLNIVNEEGDWNEWSRTIASQVLSKQPLSLAKSQLNEKYDQKKQEYDEIMSLTNPVIKKKLLDKFAEDADSSSVHLKAASLPGQRIQVILPMPSMKDNEIYAPNYTNGDRVVLIRYPHGGTFEIPELTVNNRNPGAKKIMGNAVDAVGINHKVAERLSGADFDGDSVLVIPNNQGKIKNSNPLEGLKGFDPQSAYPRYEGMPKLDDRGKQKLMGEVSNLITDMTIKGAHNDEIVRAVRHSMVVIDAEKHDLNYRQSARDNGIDALKAKYQGTHDNGRLKGASTIVSRASSEVRIPERKLRKPSEGGSIDPKTGKKVYVETGKVFTKTTVSEKTGKVTTKTEPKLQKEKALAVADDAFTLTSGGSKKNPGTPIEGLYAEHSNKLKALANQARKDSLSVPKLIKSASASRTYAKEVASLKIKLDKALYNAPLERKAQILGNAVLKQKTTANPNLTKEQIKKLKGQALTEARLRVGAKKERVVIEPKEWEAIQAGAVSTNFLSKILDNADSTHVKALATPRARTVMTDGKIARAKVMLSSGKYTQAEIAAALGVPVSTLHEALF